mmetsp:Transcript_5491/g.8532  ORF Transcript_5491/g.8532 Transcript_5491/m.8532 type:complete len:95 (-) Transcript_5491:240-524(-)
MPKRIYESIDQQGLKSYYRFPAQVVAKKLGVSLTKFKQICRRNGIQQWPYRRVTLLDKTISELEFASTFDPVCLVRLQELLELRGRLIEDPNYA